MGGPGSGAWKIVNCKKLVEYTLKVNISDWQRSKKLATGTVFTHEWIDENGFHCGYATVTAYGCSIEISYMIDGKRIKPLIAIEWVKCLRFHRAFFVCPDCGRRVRDLFLGGHELACRHCNNLGYKSRRNGLKE